MFTKKYPYVIIVALPVLIHSPIWLGLIDFFSGDGSDLIPYVYGTKLLQYQTLREFGELPLWNPYFFFGQPVVGNIQYALFYPLNVCFLLFPFFHALWVYYALHMIIAGLGTYWLCRNIGAGRQASLLAACLFMLNGRLIYYINAGWIPYFGSISWVPFILLAAVMVIERKELYHSILLAATLSMSLLAGTPQYTLMAIGLFAIQWAWATITIRSGEERFSLLLRSLLAGLLFFLLISVQLFPAYEQFTLSSRVFMTGESLGFHFEWNLQQWFRLLLRPEILRHDYAWDLCAYIGIGGLILVIPGLSISRRNLPLILIWGFVPLFISLGPALSTAAFIIKTVPGMSFLTSSSRYLIFTILMFCILAGFGLDKVIQTLKKNSAAGLMLYFSCSGLIIAILAWLIPTYDQSSAVPMLRLWIGLIVFLILSIWLLLRKNRLPLILFTLCLIADPLWLLADILGGGYRKSDLQAPVKITAALQNHGGPVRVATLQPVSLKDNLLTPFDDWISIEFRIPRAGGYEPLAMLRTLQFLTKLDSTGGIRQPMWGFRPWAYAAPGLYKLAGVTHIVSSEPLETPHLKLMAHDMITMPHFHGGWWKNQPVYLYQNLGALPKAFFRQHGARVPVTPIDLKTSSPNKMHLQFETKVPGIVVISESYHDGWVGRNKAGPITVRPFLDAFISLKVDSGRHDVFLEFAPQSYLLGRRLTLSGLLLIGIILSVEKFRSKARIRMESA